MLGSGLNSGVITKVLLFSVAQHGMLGEARVLQTPSCSHKMTVCVLLFQKVQQVARFLLPDTMMPPHLMKGHGSQVILLVSGLELALFTIHGVQLAVFQDHQRPITSMWVVSVGRACVVPPSPEPAAPPPEPAAPPHLDFHFKDQSRVVTASFDLSLRVYMWNKERKVPVLKSCYHLLGGSHRWAR